MNAYCPACGHNVRKTASNEIVTIDTDDEVCEETTNNLHMFQVEDMI